MEQNKPRVYQIDSPDQLHYVLENAGFPLEKWGDGPTKTYEDLWQEIADGESVLIHPESFEELDEYGEVVRQTNVLGIDIFAEVQGERYQLREDRQVFKDGRGERRRDLITSIAEKIKQDEDRASAVLRAVDEELGVSGVLNLKKGEEIELWKITHTYPSLASKLNIFKYSVTLADEDFRPEGYMEDQPAKQIFFVWEKV